MELLNTIRLNHFPSFTFVSGVFLVELTEANPLLQETEGTNPLLQGRAHLEGSDDYMHMNRAAVNVNVSCFIRV